MHLSRALALSLSCCLAPLAVSAIELQWPLPEGAEQAGLRLQLPDGGIRDLQFAAGADPRILLDDAALWPVGSYRYELQFAPALDAAARAALQEARDTDAHAAVVPIPPVAGSFHIDDSRALAHASGLARASGASDGGAKIAVVAEDQVVQGSLCVGLVCVAAESFGYDTLRLKQNNTRIAFDDTSEGSYPANDWALVANDTASGGGNWFSLHDVTAARAPLTVAAGAPANALYVDGTGNIGLQTAIPRLDVHLVTSDTPALRLEQSNAGGFTAQTWDIGANEANFFVRDTTGGSLLPLRLRPGAPTSSIDVAADGDVGLGTADPKAALHVHRATAPDVLLLVQAPRAADEAPAPPAVGDETRLRLDGRGNLFVGGTIAQLSSRSSKENFTAIDPAALLARIAALPISTWNYREAGAGDRHLGPVAEDFHAAFGLGTSARELAPSDLAGVALAAAQALQQQVAQRDARIGELEQRLARLEALIEQIIKKLQHQGYTVIAYDTRGHGDSSWEPAGRYDLMIAAREDALQLVTYDFFPTSLAGKHQPHPNLFIPQCVEIGSAGPAVPAEA